MSVGSRQYGYSYTQSQASHNKLIINFNQEISTIIIIKEGFTLSISCLQRIA